MRLFMGLDLSLTGTGMCILREDGSVLKVGLYGGKLGRGAPVRDKIERMLDIARSVVSSVSEAKASIPGSEIVAGIEHYAYGRMRGAFADLGEINGVVKSQLWMAHSIEPKQVVVSSARKAVFGRGNVPKADVLGLLAERGLKFADHNEADAYVIAEALRCKEV